MAYNYLPALSAINRSVVVGSNVLHSISSFGISIQISLSIQEESWSGGVTTITFNLVISETVTVGTPPCYATGVRLRAHRGEIAVEALRVGDKVLTLSGDYQPIVWIGRRACACDSHPNPEEIWPVVISAGAFERGLPARDLVVSPGHAVYVDGHLVQAIRLVNGATIKQVPVSNVEYWHIELPKHDIVIAEGLPAESYLDTGNRINFEGGEKTVPHPDFGPKWWGETCVPYLDDGAPIAAVRERLLQRAEEFGFVFESEPDVHGLADGRRIEPIRLGESRYVFVFPKGVTQASIGSRTWRPAESTSQNIDPRTLGVCLSRLDVDGKRLDLADKSLSEGWSRNEPSLRQRWTTGRAVLPQGARIAIVDLCGVGRYLRHPRPLALTA